MAKNNQTDLFVSTAPLACRQLSDRQRLDWLRLCRTSGIGPVTFRDLLNHFGSAAAAIEAIENRQFGKRRFGVPSVEEVSGEVEAADRFGAKLRGLSEPGYPRYLQAIEAPPPLIYTIGDNALADRPAVGIVGSRQASAAGLKMTQMLAHELSQAGFVIVSGLARGIDRQAHLSALQGGTIAVLAGGVDHIYPYEHKDLYREIGDVGLLVSERVMGYRPQGRDFPRRNRLISGISLGVIVVEAALRSGSLTTARFAGEQGRLIFAVPGHPLDPRAAGTNHLIKDGAFLVGEVEDVLLHLRSQIEGPCQIERPGLFEPSSDGIFSGEGFPPADGEDFGQGAARQGYDFATRDLHEVRERLLELLGPTPLERDHLVRLLGCEVAQLQVLLLELDLEGRLQHHGNQRVSLTYE